MVQKCPGGEGLLWVYQMTLEWGVREHNHIQSTYQGADWESWGGRGSPAVSRHSLGEVRPASVMRAHLLPPLWAFSGCSPIAEGICAWIFPNSSFMYMVGLSSEKAMAPHSSTLAWKIPRTEEPGRLQSMGSLRVRHDWVTSLSLFTFMHWRRKWQPTPVFLPGESQGWRSLVGCRLWGRKESDMTEAT